MGVGQRFGAAWLAFVGLLTAVELPACGKRASLGNVGDSGIRADVVSRDSRQADRAVVSDGSKVSRLCPTGTIGKSKGKAETCTCDDECQTGFCVDGVCCTSACEAGCKACNLPMALGECALVPAGRRPRDPSVCPASTPATCGLDGTCDGQGACRRHVQGTACRTGRCDGDSVSGAMACDGQGRCLLAFETLCSPYACDPSTNQCAFECATNAQCAAGQKCDNRSCGQKLNGARCSKSGECASGFCADGVCCNVACQGACASCNQTGSTGRCRFVGVGQPHRACPAQDRSTCGTTGLCDGFGACATFPANTICKSAVCAGNALLSTAGTCDGTGTCREPAQVDCEPYGCRNGACLPTCASDSDCAPGIACATSASGKSSCGKKRNGQSCQEGDECASGQCVDRVCCESECAGSCRSCALPGSPGRCLSVAGGADDPRGGCKDEGAASCGHNGLCDGNGGCQKYASDQICAPESCVAGSYTPPSTCNAAGQCVAPRAIPCNPFLCNGSSCFATCGSDMQCMPGQFCANSSCGPKPNGAVCSAGGECQSTVCAQGVCCNRSCADSCMACNLPGSLGLCTAVIDGSPDPQGKCKADAPAGCGSTGACLGGGCALLAKGRSCKPAVCSSSSSQTPASTCDGAGVCVTPADLSCGTYVCAGGACKASCLSDADCVPPNTCVGNSCGLRPLGTACTSHVQCLSGICSEGVCCDSPCSEDVAGGLCRSCKVAGKIGMCQPVPTGGGDPKGRCPASSPVMGDCSRDGTCNGAGACRAWSSSVGCRWASCSGGNLSPAVNCDGAGTCPVATTVSCGLYACSTSSPSCLNTCSSNDDCRANVTCNLQSNRCGDKLPNGESCKSGSDCTSGQCVDGTCCQSACDGACESCAVSGKLGVCSPVPAGQEPRPGTSDCQKSKGPCGNTGKCDGVGACQQQSSCNDGDACTQSDTCDSSGRCVGTPVPCTALDTCHIPGSCDPATGRCSHPSKADGATCDDGNACTRKDTCQTGVCVGGGPVTCAAPDPCHLPGTCAPSTGQCSSPVMEDGASCQDGNACTESGRCQAGICVGRKLIVCPVPDQCHDLGICDPSTGNCSTPNKADGTGCDDGNLCTQYDTCQSGRCVGAKSIACLAFDQCHDAGQCDAATGRCSAPAKDNGIPCNDGNECTQGEACQGGACVGGKVSPDGTGCGDGQICLGGFCARHAGPDSGA